MRGLLLLFVCTVMVGCSSVSRSGNAFHTNSGVMLGTVAATYSYAGSAKMFPNYPDGDIFAPASGKSRVIVFSRCGAQEALPLMTVGPDWYEVVRTTSPQSMVMAYQIQPGVTGLLAWMPTSHDEGGGRWCNAIGTYTEATPYSVYPATPDNVEAARMAAPAFLERARSAFVTGAP